MHAIDRFVVLLCGFAAWLRFVVLLCGFAAWLRCVASLRGIRFQSNQQQADLQSIFL